VAAMKEIESYSKRGSSKEALFILIASFKGIKPKKDFFMTFKI